MESSKRKPKIELKKCPLCDKVVKATLFQKQNRFFDYYLCLNNLQAKEFHKFEVPTNAYHQAAAIEEGTKAVAGGVILLTLSGTFDAPPPPEPSSDALASLGDVSGEEGSFIADLLTFLVDSAG